MLLCYVACIFLHSTFHLCRPCLNHACRSPLPKGLWPALTLMLLGCGMVIGSKATGAGTHGFKHSVDYQPRFGPQQALWARVHSAESAQLCVAVFGEQRARWLCGLADEGHDEQEAPSWAGQDGSSRWQSAAADGKAFGRPLESDSLDRLAPAHSKSVVVTGKAKPKPGPRPKPKPHHRGSGMGMHDILGIALSFWGACCVAGFMTVVQVRRLGLADLLLNDGIASSQASCACAD